MGSCTSLPIETSLQIKVTSPAQNYAQSPTFNGGMVNSISVSSLNSSAMTHSASASPLTSHRGSVVSINGLSQCVIEPQFEKLARSYIGRTYYDYIRVNSALGLDCYQSSATIGRIDNFQFILSSGEYVLFTVSTPHHFSADSKLESVNEFIINSPKQCIITEVHHVIIQ